MYEHCEGLLPGFTRRYRVKRLVYFEEAITREKRVQRWHRKWRLEPIEARNPQWKDLWVPLVD